MSAAAQTPRVRILVVCDEVIPSATEEDVFTLEGVRQHLRADSFPALAPLNLFLLLSSPRAGTFQGKVLVVNEVADHTIRYMKFSASFEQENDLLPLFVEIGSCVFPTPGIYTFQVWFSSQRGTDALKGEQPFLVLENENE